MCVCSDGSVLCAVGYEDGQVRVYSLSISLSWGSEFKLSSSLATGVPRTSTYSGIAIHQTDLHCTDGHFPNIIQWTPYHTLWFCPSLMAAPFMPAITVCVLPTESYGGYVVWWVCVLSAGTELCQWSVKDITTSGSYQAKKEKVYHAPSPISWSAQPLSVCIFQLPPSLPPSLSLCSICASSLCLCSQDTAADNTIIVLDEMSGVQSEGRGWPVEVLLVTTQDGDIIVLNR